MRRHSPSGTRRNRPRAAHLAIQVHGAYGYSAEYGIERYSERAGADHLRRHDPDPQDDAGRARSRTPRFERAERRSVADRRLGADAREASRRLTHSGFAAGFVGVARFLAVTAAAFAAVSLGGGAPRAAPPCRRRWPSLRRDDGWGNLRLGAERPRSALRAQGRRPPGRPTGWKLAPSPRRVFRRNRSLCGRRRRLAERL